MTSATVTYRPAPRFPWLLLAVAVVALAIILSAHATVKHGSDAEAVRQACSQNGHYQLWQAMERPGKYYRVCKVDTGVFGLQIVECTARGLRERTSFIVRGASGWAGGSWFRTKEYLSSKAIQVAQDALCRGG